MGESGGQGSSPLSETTTLRLGAAGEVRCGHAPIHRSCTLSFRADAEKVTLGKALSHAGGAGPCRQAGVPSAVALTLLLLPLWADLGPSACLFSRAL